MPMPMMPPMPVPTPGPQTAQAMPNPMALQRQMLLGLMGGDGLPIGFTMPKPYTPPVDSNNNRPSRDVEPY